MKKLLYVIAALITFGTATYFLVNEDLPKGEAGPEAEALADKMLTAVNIQGWDSINVIKWTFRDSHSYIWHKEKNLVHVSWDNHEVFMNTKSQKGKAKSDNQWVENEDIKNELIQTAWSYFANDSFWFSAPFKVRDPGTERRLVQTVNGDALLVTYTTGGVTPGDSYLWFLNDEGLPISWKMWVNILPIGGLQFSWDNWGTYHHNTKIASSHSGIIDVPINDLATGETVESINADKNPFDDVEGI